MDAEKYLTWARAKFGSKDFGHAISDLQGAEERIAKALMMEIGMIAQSDEMSLKTDIAFPSVKHKQPEQLSHNWHERLFKDLPGYVDTLEWAGSQYEGKKGGESTAAFWQATVPDWREKLKKARAVKANPKPSLEHLDAILKDCDNLLSQLDETIGRIKIPQAQLPSLELTDALVVSFLKEFGLKMKASERHSREKAELANYHDLVSNLESVTKSAAERTILLMILAVLNVHLWEHHTTGSYPSSQYSETFPMVVRFNDLASLLERILVRTKGGVQSS